MFEDLRKAIIHACGGMTREEFDTTLKDHLLSNRISASKELDLLLPSSTLVSICDYDAFIYQWKEERTMLEKERRVVIRIQRQKENRLYLLLFQM